MGNKLFIGNIDWNATEEGLKDHFAPYGEVTECVIIKDKFSGRSKGFGFVTYATADEAAEAIKNLDGKDWNGRPLAVSEARPPKPREER